MKTDLTPDITVIKKTVAEYFKLDVFDLELDTRRRDICTARQISFYFAKKYTKYSLAKIGLNIANRDHATVLNAIKVVNNLLDTDKVFKKQMHDLDKIINNRIERLNGFCSEMLRELLGIIQQSEYSVRKELLRQILYKNILVVGVN